LGQKRKNIWETGGEMILKRLFTVLLIILAVEGVSDECDI